jgi:predicted transcriptional regulator
MPKEKLPISGFRLDPEVLSKLKQIAKENDRSVNWVVNDALKQFVNKEQ